MRILLLSYILLLFLAGCGIVIFLGLGGIEPPQLAYQASTLTIKLQAL